MTNENEHRWKILQQKVFENRICNSFELFRRNNIEPILIKGWAAALNYPNIYDRTYSDIDLAVAENDFRKASNLLAEKDWYIDLHKELRHLDSLPWLELFKNSRLITTEGCAVRLLSREDHLRVLCVHWLNDGGAYMERLWDIYYAVDNRPNDFDWTKCLGKIDGKRRGWIICALKLAEKYLNLDLKGIDAVDKNYRIPAWVIETVEKEWQSETKLKPLKLSFRHNAEFFEQLKLRLPPNPLQATIEMNAEIDDKSRWLIQAGNVIARFQNLVKAKINKSR